MDKQKVTVPTYLKDLREELKKVSWPTRDETIKLTITVFVISLIVALYIGIIDVALAKVLDVLSNAR